MPSSVSISRRITVAAVAVTMSIVITFGLLSYLVMRSNMQNQIRQHMEFEGMQIRERIQSILETINHEVQSMAENLIIVNALIDSEGRDFYIEPFLQSYKLPEQIPFVLTLCDFEGKPIKSSTDVMPEYSEQEMVSILIDEERPYAQISHKGGQNQLLVAYPVLYGATGMAEGMLIMEVPVDHLFDMVLSPLLEAADSPFLRTAGFVWTDTLHEHKETSLIRAEVDTSKLKRLEEPLVLSEPLNGLGLSFSMFEDTERAYRPLRKMAWTYLVAGFFILGITYFFSQRIASRLTKPLADLTMHADKVSFELGEPVLFEAVTEDEVGSLSRAFNTMVERLRESHETLEKRVRERTAELESANRELALEISERRRAEDRIRESEERFRTVVTNSPIVFFRIDHEGIFTLSEGKGLESLGLSPGQVVGQSVFDVYRDFPEIIENMKIALSGKNHRFLARVGDQWFDTIVTPVIEDDGKVREVLGVANDISERKKIEETLEESNARLALSRFALESAGDALFLAGPDARLHSVNEAACRTLGYTREELLNMAVFDVDPDYPKERWDEHWVKMQTVHNLTLETRHRRKDGSVIPVEVTTSFFRHGEKEYIIGFARDISDRKRAEQEISRSLREKEVLLREIHHRVKNNMAIISALLKLQSRQSKNDEVVQILKDSQNRINSMALVHEKLYRTQDFSRISMRDYVSELTTHLIRSFGTERAGVEAKIDIVDIEFNIDTLMPCGLILNELITNSMKHAFEGIEHPEINITIFHKDGEVEIDYFDNGKGIPEEVEFPSQESLGLQIIHMLSHQLKGTVHLDRAAGSRFTLTFPVPAGEEQ